MNAIREIKIVKNGKVEIELPENFDGKEVEVIVLSNFNDSKEKLTKLERKNRIKKYAGVFNRYAKPELIPFEKDIAWTKVAKDKYDTR